jgi:hypothetical protein
MHPMEKARAQRFLQEPYLPADCRLGNAQFVRRMGKAAQAGDRFKLDQRR